MAYQHIQGYFMLNPVKKARRQLHKNAANNIEQVLEATPPQSTNYTATYLPSRKLSKLDKPDIQDTAGEAGTSSKWCTPTYGRAKARRPARTYIEQPCEDTGCSPEDLPVARKGQGYLCWRHDMIYIYIYIYIYTCLHIYIHYL